mmetsp:Transcript_21477/g.44675  ORF Transcript_21477/g.44675 Transcript_21477/m.44675 type:complete len:919 (-) Transcript_21477:181-2937(-)
MRSWEQHFPSHGEVHDDNFRLAPLSDHSSPPGTAMTTAESESADEVLMVPSLVEESHKKKTSTSALFLSFTPHAHFNEDILSAPSNSLIANPKTMSLPSSHSTLRKVRSLGSVMLRTSAISYNDEFDPSEDEDGICASYNKRFRSNLIMSGADERDHGSSPPRSIFARFPSSLLTRSVSGSSLASPSSVSTFLASFPLSRTFDNSNRDYAGPTTLSSFKLIQASIMMFVIMAFLNFAVGNCLIAYHDGNIFASFLANHAGNDVHDSKFADYDHVDVMFLSTELIRPLSHSMQSKRRNHLMQRKHVVFPKGILGSAVLSSVADWLSPVLPFAGGIDLRKLHPSEVYACFRYYFVDSRDGHSSQVYKTIPRGGGSSSSSDVGSSAGAGASRNSNNSISKYKPSSTNELSRPLVLGASEPFMPLEQIAELTLEELAQAFLPDSFHSNEYNSPWAAVDEGGGEQGHRLPDSNERTNNLIRKIVDAAAHSRGEGVLPAKLHSEANQDDIALSPPHGDIDASLFCAALRIFAEWRMLRTVPEGYKSYAVGMSLGHKDVVQNVGKIETAMREWIEVKRQDLTDETEDNEGQIHLHGPTLRQLLEYERANGIHTDLPRLKDGTSAIAILWSSRQLRYQSAVFRNILDTPAIYPDTKTAVGAAYKEVYDRFHGWTVQKIFNYSFKAAPDASLIYNTMYPKKLKEIVDRARQGFLSDGSDNGAASTDSFEEGDHVDIVSPAVPADDFVMKTSIGTLPMIENGEYKVIDLPFLEHTLKPEVNSSFAFESDDDDQRSDLWSDLGKQILIHWTKLGQEVDNIINHIDMELTKAGNEWNKISHQVVGEWDNFLNGIFGGNPQKSRLSQDKSEFSSGEDRQYLQGEELEMYTKEEMDRYVREQITEYLRLLDPILLDVMGLFDEMNMDDPTKV